MSKIDQWRLSIGIIIILSKTHTYDLDSLWPEFHTGFRVDGIIYFINGSNCKCFGLWMCFQHLSLKSFTDRLNNWDSYFVFNNEG